MNASGLKQHHGCKVRNATPEKLLQITDNATNLHQTFARFICFILDYSLLTTCSPSGIM